MVPVQEEKSLTTNEATDIDATAKAGFEEKDSAPQVEDPWKELNASENKKRNYWIIFFHFTSHIYLTF